jgi:hypothetical protein
MGMCLTYTTLGDANIARVLANPKLVHRALAPEDPEHWPDATPPAPGLLARLFGRGKPPADVPLTLELAPGEVRDGDADKAWHGLHYLLTKTAWGGEPPLDFIAVGGTTVGDEEVGLGPARVFTSEQARAIHAALAPIDAAWLRARFDPADMKRLDIYPDIWDRDDEDDALGYCIENFEALKAFIADAVQRRVGLVLFLS